MRRSCAAAAAVAVVLGLTACGSSSKGGSGTSSNSTSPNGPSTGPGSSSASSQVLFSTSNKYDAHVKRAGQTILIGVTNDDQGSFAEPEYHQVLDRAIKDINANGGIDGAQLKEDFCVGDGSPEKAVTCANQFVTDHVAIVTYGLTISAYAMTPILAGAKIPIVVNVSFDPGNSPDIRETGPSSQAYSLYNFLALKTLGSKHPAFIATNDSTHVVQGKVIKAWGKIVGFNPVIAPYQAPANADWTTAVQTALTQGADGMFIDILESECTSIVHAAHQLNFKGPITGTCSQYVKTLPSSETSNTYFSSTGFLPASAATAPPQLQKNMALYAKAMDAIGLSAKANGDLEFIYAATQNIATLLRTVSAPKITAEAVTAAMNEDHFLPSFDAPDFNCGGKLWAGDPKACSASMLIMKNNVQNGKLVLTPIKKTNYGFFNDPQAAAQSNTLPTS